MKRVEGFVETIGGKVWYEIVGNKNSAPLVVVHGGPGYPHDSLSPLEDLASDRNIIFYDQLGCGNSGKTDKKSFWSVEYFVKELQTIVSKLNLKNYHMIGHSWGAGLSVSFALTQPKGLRSLILADPYLSTPIWIKDAERLLKKLPVLMQKILKEGESDSKEFKKASKEFYYRYVWRMRKLPVDGLKSHHKMNIDIYTYMWGPEEFSPIGSLKNFDLSNRLSKINIPVMFLCGRHDEATPESTKYFQSKIPNSKLKIFEKSAHMPQWTERKEYIKTIRHFLKEQS